MSHQISLPFVTDKVERLLLWRDPKASGIVFGGATAACLAVFLNPFPLTTVVAYAGATVVLAFLLWALGAKIMNRSGPPIPQQLIDGYKKEELQELAAKLQGPINAVLGVAGRLASGNDPALSIKVFGGLLAVGWVASRVSLIGLAYTVMALAFTLPKGYELRKDDCDRALAAAGSKAKELYGKLDEAVFKKIPKAATKKVQ